MMAFHLTQANHLYQLTTSRNEQLSVNHYLVEEEHELTLVDASVSQAFSFTLQVAERLNKPIANIVLTHAHHDHTDGLDLIKNAFPAAEVFISEREDKILRGDLALEPNETDTPIRGIFPKNLQTKPDVLLRDGDQIGSLVAISAPGHTPGSMAFLDVRTQTLIAGDAFQTIGGLGVAGVMRPIFPMVANGTWNKQKAIESAIILRDFQPKQLAVGHGGMLHNPCEAMDWCIEEALNTQN